MLEAMDTRYVNLENVRAIARGDNQRFLLYLSQFKELMPDRLKLLKEAEADDNRELIRQILHKMSPQLQFFGIQQMITPIQRLELEYMSMSKGEIQTIVGNVIGILEHALIEINDILSKEND